jgi:hypothetical protein
VAPATALRPDAAVASAPLSLADRVNARVRDRRRVAERREALRRAGRFVRSGGGLFVTAGGALG